MRFAGALVLLIAQIASGEDSGTIQISPARPKQGDTVIVTLRMPSANNATVSFRDREVPMFRIGQSDRALLGTSPDTRPGVYELRVRTDAGEFARKLHIDRTKFPIQRLTLPPSKNRLRKDPRIPEDKVAIRQALRRQTDEQMWQGAFQLPVRGSIRTQYGLKRIVNRDPNYGWHKGLDLRGAAGTPIKAAAGGIISLVRSCILEGNVVIIDHGHGISTIHMHLSSFAVRQGERVNQGDVIGRVGNTGLSSGPHLHWGVYVNGTPVHPRFWLTNNRV